MFSTPESVSSAHPLVDDRGTDWVATFSDRSIVHASVARTGFLVDANRARLIPVVVTDSSARLTWPMLQLVAEFGAVWLAQAADGPVVNALTGRSSPTIDDAVAAGSLPVTPGEMSDRISVSSESSSAASRRVQITAVVNHRAHADTVLGETLETLAEFFDVSVDTWGEAEPLTRQWDAEAVTRRVRHGMPETVRYLAAGGGLGRGFSASVKVARTEHGVTEQLRVLASLADDVPSTGVSGLFERLAAQYQVVFASAFQSSGRSDLTFGVEVSPTPTPIALLVGARAVRDSAVDLTALVEQLGALRLGRPRTPSVLLGFDHDSRTAWGQVRQATALFDPMLATAALGHEATHAP